ncbi:TUT1 [Mytilus edulis]|uniref:Speckle targeted PIP5K1A-regulated poly(A) polymerase n=1 Tax=Mytilus edulis TaxID=6550 RepID=A0A8S3RZ20_MYTED|nr:TUT1 [Mytilus edulis]
MPARGRSRGSMFVICDVCTSTISSAEEYDRHMAGKKHNEKLQAYLEKKRVAECSIFVKGFPPRTEENELVLYFQNFGPINKIVMETHEKKKLPARFCIIEFGSKEGATKAVEYEPHILNSSRLTVRPRSFRELKLQPYFPWEKEKEEKESRMLPWNRGEEDEDVNEMGPGPGFGGPPQLPSLLGAGPGPFRGGHPGDEQFYMDDNFDQGGGFGGGGQWIEGGGRGGGFGGRGRFGGGRGGLLGNSPGPDFGGRGGPDFGGRRGPDFGGRGGPDFGGRGGPPGGYPGPSGGNYGNFGRDPPTPLGPPKSIFDLKVGEGTKRMKGMPSLPGMGKKARKGKGADDPQDPLPVTIVELKKKCNENTCITIQSQMTYLVDLIQASPEELQQRYYICKVLEQALSPFFPGVTVNQFGSSVNGFGLKGCDMDVYLGLDKIGISVRSTNIDLPYTRDVHSLKKTSGPLQQADVDGMTNGDKCKLISRILIEHAPACSNTQIIPSTRCPIIRFKHESSGIKCDLSLDNQLALQNTRLLQALSQYDPRIKPLVYAVRYWGRLKHLAGNIKTGPRMSNYALTLMVVYYLQNTNPVTLPTIQSLADLSSTKTIIGPWDCSFVGSNFIPPTHNVQTCEELLAGFFKFFSHFDFKANALSIRTGSVLPVAKITLDNTMKLAPINIQDPFVLDHNVTQNMNETIRELMIKEFNIAAYKAERWQAIEFAQTKSLIDVLDDRVPEGFDETLALSSIPGIKLGEYQFLVELKAPALSPQLLRTLEAEGNMYLAWCKKMMGFLYTVIEKIMMFNCETVSTNMPDVCIKSRKYDHSAMSERSLKRGLKRPHSVVEEAGDEESSTKEETSEEVLEDPRTELYKNAEFYIDMNTYIMCRIWAERKKIGNMLKERGFTDSMELEQTISERLYYDNHYENKSPIMEMRIIMKSVILNNRAEIMVDVSGPPGQGEFHCVYHYLKKFTLKLAEKFFDAQELPPL